MDVNEVTGEADPVVQLIDFHNPERNQFHAINQFRIDTPGCVKAFIIPDIVLFVNGMPLAVIECKKGSATCANPMQEAFVQLQRYMRRRKETELAGLTEGEPRLFHGNLLLIRSSGLEADYGTVTSGAEPQQQATQDAGVEDSCRSAERLSTIRRVTRCCDDRLNPPNTCRFATASDWPRQVLSPLWVLKGTAMTTRWPRP